MYVRKMGRLRHVCLMRGAGPGTDPAQGGPGTRRTRHKAGGRVPGPAMTPEYSKRYSTVNPV